MTINTKKIDTKYICTVALGIALYCVLSMSMRLPLGVGHITVDLGYVVLTVFACCFGSIPTAIVGGCSAAIMSILNGWFSLEWILANVVVGLLVGSFYDKSNTRKGYWKNIALIVFSVGLGMLVVKTATSYILYSIPPLVKLPKSFTAWVIDSIVMCLAVPIADRINKMLVIKNKEN